MGPIAIPQGEHLAEELKAFHMSAAAGFRTTTVLDRGKLLVLAPSPRMVQAHA